MVVLDAPAVVLEQYEPTAGLGDVTSAIKAALAALDDVRPK